MNSEYRDNTRMVAKESSWTFWRFLPLFLVVVVVLSGLGFFLKSAHRVGDTVIEREVFERSYQRSEALKAQIATDEATLVEIERKLSNPNLDENTRFNLEAQAAAARSRIAATKGRQ